MNVRSVTIAQTVVIVATAHHAMATVATMQSAHPKFAMRLPPQTHPHRTKRVAMSPVKTGVRVAAKAVVVVVDVDAAPSAAHALTRTVSLWTTHKPHWALQNPTVKPIPTKPMWIRPSRVPMATLQVKAAKSAPATVMAANVARARTAVIARTAVAMSPATVTIQRPNPTLNLHR